jgi:hypothetical protein
MEGEKLMFSAKFIKLTNAETNKVFILNVGLIAKVTECIVKTKITTFKCRRIYLSDGEEVLVNEELNDIYDAIC